MLNYISLKNQALISYLLSCWFVGCGFYKIFYYTNYSFSSILSSENVNAYVGGDAYNYMINSQRATAYFVLALLFVVLGSAFLIINEIRGEAN